VPFGASSLTLTASSTRRLGGGLSGALWWIIVLVGSVLSVLAAGMTERLVRARRTAERDTAMTSVLLAEERTIAQMLQQALLPEALPAVPGLRSQSRYVTGTAGVDIGGDWYDLLPVDHDRVYFVVGDVSGRGVRAGTTMAALRFAIHAFVYEGHAPAVVLDRLTRMIDVGRDGQFATVLCGVLDVSRREVTLASAGHLPPLVIGEQARYVDIPTGPPVGVRTSRRYESVTVSVPPQATLLAFTDGLVERPDEALDASLERLRADIGTPASLEAVFEQLGSSGGADDIAILGVQWTT
jgi:serine phosphatase RsbU (regulator of sigma subunit)